MTTVNVAEFRKKLFFMLEQTVRYNEPINISTKEGSAVLISEEDYNSLIETLRILSKPSSSASISIGREETFDECLSRSEVGL